MSLPENKVSLPSYCSSYISDGTPICIYKTRLVSQETFRYSNYLIDCFADRSNHSCCCFVDKNPY